MISSGLRGGHGKTILTLFCHGLNGLTTNSTAQRMQTASSLSPVGPVAQYNDRQGFQDVEEPDNRRRIADTSFATLLPMRIICERWKGTLAKAEKLSYRFLHERYVYPGKTHWASCVSLNRFNRILYHVNTGALGYAPPAWTPPFLRSC